MLLTVIFWSQQAAIHFESSHTPGNEQVKRVDALVEQASASSRPDGTPGLSTADREEISSVYLEVQCNKILKFCQCFLVPK
jgi:hypothetical protein